MNQETDGMSTDENASAVKSGRRTADPSSNGRRTMVRNIALSVLLSFITFAVVIYFTYERGALRSVAQSLHPFYLVLAGITVAGRIAVGGFRLRYISHKTIQYKTAVRGQLAWEFFSSVTPSVIGGGPLAAVYISKNQNIPVGVATACLLYAMFLDQLFFALSVPLILLSTYYFDAFPQSIGTVGAASFAAYFVGLMLWVIIFGYLTLARPDLLARVTQRLFRFRWLRKFRKKVDVELKELQHRAKIIRNQRWTFFANGFLLTLITWAARFLLLIFIIFSVFPQVDVLMVIIRNAMMTLGALVLPTPGGSGGVEGLYAIFIGSLIPKAAVAPTLIAWRILGYYVVIFLGAYVTLNQVQKLLEGKQHVNGELTDSEFELPETLPSTVETSRPQDGP